MTILRFSASEIDQNIRYKDEGWIYEKFGIYTGDLIPPTKCIEIMPYDVRQQFFNGFLELDDYSSSDPMITIRCPLVGLPMEQQFRHQMDMLKWVMRYLACDQLPWEKSFFEVFPKADNEVLDDVYMAMEQLLFYIKLASDYTERLNHASE